MKVFFRFFILVVFSILINSCNTHETKEKRPSSRGNTMQRSEKNLFSNKENAVSSTGTPIPDTGDRIVSTRKRSSWKNNKVIITEQDYDKDLKAMAALFRHLKKSSQFFSIDPQKDTSILCIEGTRITIPSFAFVQEDGNVVKEVVRVEVTEYLSKEDFLLANLSTASDGKMLESGGMLNVKAMSQGKEVKLKTGASVRIEVPAESLMPDMELFYGNHDPDGSVNWRTERNTQKKQQEKGLKKKAANKFVSVSKVISYIDTTGKVFEEKKKIHIWADSAKKVSKVDSVEFTFTINKKGEVKDGKIFINNNLIKNGKLTYNYNVYYINKTTRIKSTRKLNFTNTYFVLAPATGNREQYRLGRDELKKVRKRIKETQGPVTVRVKHLYCNSDTLLSYNYRGYLDSINRFKGYYYSTDIEDTAAVNAAKTSYYAFEAKKLDWINVDRFYKTEQPMVAFAIETEKTNYVDVKVVFKKINSIMPGYNFQGRTEFKSMPEGEQVTIVALMVKEGTTFLAIKETTIKEGLEKGLEFQPVSNEELKARIQAIN